MSIMLVIGKLKCHACVRGQYTSCTCAVVAYSAEQTVVFLFFMK